MTALVLSGFDRIRSRALRLALARPALRALFLDRPRRLLVLFSLAAIANFAFAATVPLVAIALGPLLVGVPHLLASARYSARMLVPRESAPAAASALVGLMVALALLRGAVGPGGAAAGVPNAVELAGAALVAAFAVFAAGTAFLLSGAADPWMRWDLIGSALPGSRETLGGVAESIRPGGTDDLAMVRLACAFAFGQGLHYFVWLKAIPDQSHAARTPTSFTHSWRLLRNEFGPATILGVGGATLGLLALAAAGRPDLARDLYFVLAAFHGYLELAALGAKGA